MMKKRTVNMVQEVEKTWSKMAMDMSAIDPNRTGFLPNLQESNSENCVEENNSTLLWFWRG